MPTEEVPSTQIAALLQQAMDKENLSLHDVANELGLTYEYVRRLVRGMNNPSKAVLRLIAQRFKWDFEEVETYLVQDRFRLKNGVMGGIAQEFDPEVEPFERGFRFLEPEQKEMLLSQLRMFHSQNRRHNRGGLPATALEPAVPQPKTKSPLKPESKGKKR